MAAVQRRQGFCGEGEMTETETAQVDQVVEATVKAIEKYRSASGSRFAELYVMGLTAGVVHYLVAARGRREAYDYVQGTADGIIEAELPR